MADNYLERHRADYEQRKQQWLLKKRHVTRKHTARKNDKRRPDDEAL